MIIRIPASRDNTIATAYNNNFRSRSWDANLGYSPYLQVFKKLDETSSSIYGNDIARSLLYFDLSAYHDCMNFFNLSSASLSCSLKMYNMPHADTVPTSFELYVHPVSQSWDEGMGIDADKYKDAGYSSWLSATSVQSWSQTGSDYIDSIYDIEHFDIGTEDLDCDITNIWNYWYASGNYGLIVKLNLYEETNDVDYYKKDFYSRHVSDIRFRPFIEVKVDDDIQDRRGSLILGRSGSIYIYNIVDGTLENLSCGSSSLDVTLYDTIVSASTSYSVSFLSSYVSTGIYKCDLYVPTTYTGSVLYDVWSTGSTQYVTGTVHITSSIPSLSQKPQQLLVLFDDLKEEYKRADSVRINFFIRNARWNLNTYYENISDLPVMLIDNVYYQIEDYVNNFTVITASEFTKCSYDSNGHYFQIPMANFYADSYYEILLKMRRNNIYETIKGDWKFKVVE